MARVREVFTTLRVEVMAGQYLDLRLDGATGADPDAARQVAVLKSGRYTVTRPLELGLAAATTARPTRGSTGPWSATATPSAWPSSCATTCSGCSATRRPPARATPMTCERASARS